MNSPLDCFLMYSAQAVEKVMATIAVKVKMMVSTTTARTRRLGETVVWNNEWDSVGT